MSEAAREITENLMIKKYLDVLQRNRRIGYTRTAIEGLSKQHASSFLVVLNQSEVNYFKKYEVKAVAIDSLPEFSIGRNGVFIPDNSFLEHALSEALSEVKKLVELLEECGRY